MIVSGAAVTASAIVVVPVRGTASVMVMLSVLPPADVPGATVASQEYVPSPATASPFVPSSYSVCVAEPPMLDRLAVTDWIGLDGFVRWVAATVSRLVAPACTAAGEALPVPVGFVLGLPPQAAFTGLALLRGAGAPVEKSALLSSESVQPPLARKSASVVLGVGAVPEPS